MRLDHLLSKEEVRVVLLLICQEQIEMPKESKKTKKRASKKKSSGDALMGHTRSHPEHDG